MRLEGKVALITGAAAGIEGELMGFGGAAARLFCREGAKVALTDINEGLGEKTAADIRAHGGDAIFVRLDVTREEDWKNAVKTTVSTYGRLNVVVNNAGIGGGGSVEEMTVESWDRMMDIHAKGAFLGTKHTVAELRKAGGGSIINVSSIDGITGSLYNDASYHAAKGAIRTFTKAAAIQYAKDGIRVNSVHPGYAVTPLISQDPDDPKYKEWVNSMIPMGRWAQPDEIAYGMLYLASDESSYVTGSELVIDGGWTAQ